MQVGYKGCFYLSFFFEVTIITILPIR
uniref:Uncharacterized protein n=1 Tax=Anguilla anguilla TaxID=7936 RepID=A0A0E9UPY0_ANGAN